MWRLQSLLVVVVVVLALEVVEGLVAYFLVLWRFWRNLHTLLVLVEAGLGTVVQGPIQSYLS
jgi:hypothetical protein